MIHTFRWSGADILRLLEEARSAPTRFMTFAEKLERYGLADRDVSAWRQVDRYPDGAADVPPALLFVGDDGVYLMSNAELPKRKKRLIVHAAGYRNTHLCTSDFAERLGEEIFANIRPTDQFIIRLDPDGDTFQVTILPGGV